jgi:hypothetical protein
LLEWGCSRGFNLRSAATMPRVASGGR